MALCRLLALAVFITALLLPAAPAQATPLGTWSTKAPLPTARRSLVAATASTGQVYAFGGIAAGGPTNVVEAYTPSTNTWAARASIPGSPPDVQFKGASAPNGLLYLLLPQGATYTFLAYDPAT